MAEPKKIFISYNHKDQLKALKVLERLLALEPAYKVWFDRHIVATGERLADEIVKGLNGSDYYLLLISENSNASQWVKRELSFAFDLSKDRQLTLVPMMIDDAPTPLELRGLLEINARGDLLESGIDELIDFLKAQIKPGIPIEDQIPRGSPWMHGPCEEELGRLDLGDLRFLLTKRLNLPDISVLWFDVFNETMENEVAVATLAQYCVALINRSRKEEILSRLYKTLCRNHPRLAALAKLQ
jgi:hypothetical protein